MNSCSSTSASPSLPFLALSQVLLSKDPKVIRQEFGRIELRTMFDDVCLDAYTRCDGNSMIVSQAPRDEDEDLDPFLDLLYSDVDVVIMVLPTEDIEIWAIPYFHDREPLKTSKYSVTRTIDTIDSIVKSTLEITPHGKPPKVISHYHYDDWEDGEACDPKQVAALVRIAINAKMPLIHCFAGEGRSGVVATTIIAYRRILAGQGDHNTIKKALLDLREERHGCVHGPEQYQLIYDSVNVLLKQDGLI